MSLRRAAVFVALFSLTGAAHAGPPPLVKEGRAVTGLNRLLGEPIWELGGGLGTFGFSMLGGQDPGGTVALPLTPDSPPSSILATDVDPFILTAFGLPAPDPSVLNVPLRRVAAYTTFDGERHPLRDQNLAGQLEVSRTANSYWITLKQWLSASATARFDCDGRGGATVELRFKRLIPDGLYTIWGVMSTPTGPSPIPLGGVPNVVVADPRGNARFERRINFCPQQLAAGQSPMVLVEVIFHSDGATYAGVPELILGGFPPGLVTHAHLDIPVNATHLP